MTRRKVGSTWLHLELRPPADREAERARFSAGLLRRASPRPTPSYVPIRRRENDYLIDRAKQKPETY